MGAEVGRGGGISPAPSRVKDASSKAWTKGASYDTADLRYYFNVSRPRPKSFADRLPPVVPREEEDISHLSDEMADILYPGRRRRPFRMGIEFDAFEDASYARAVELAQRSPAYKETADSGRRRHRAAFGADAAAIFRELFSIVGQRPGTDVLVDNKKVPYAREIWMPLYFIHLGGDSGTG
jgi:hypothetical protein